MSSRSTDIDAALGFAPDGAGHDRCQRRRRQDPERLGEFGSEVRRPKYARFRQGVGAAPVGTFETQTEEKREPRQHHHEQPQIRGERSAPVLGQEQPQFLFIHSRDRSTAELCDDPEF